VDALGPITASSEFKDRVAAASIPSRTGGTVADTRTSEEITAAENAAKTITAGHFVDRATAVANSIETVKKVTLFSAKLHAKAHKVNSAKMELLWKKVLAKWERAGSPRTLAGVFAVLDEVFSNGGFYADFRAARFDGRGPLPTSPGRGFGPPRLPTPGKSPGQAPPRKASSSGTALKFGLALVAAKVILGAMS